MYVYRFLIYMYIKLYKLKMAKKFFATHNDCTFHFQLLMDLKYSYPVRFPFNPSDIRLEDIEVPEVLHLPMLKKV